MQSGDLHRIEQERARLKGFDETIQAAGIDIDLLLDMFDSSYDLLNRMREAIESDKKNENTVLQTMNDEGESSCILYHFKVSHIRIAIGFALVPASRF